MDKIKFVNFLCDLLVINTPDIYFFKDGELTSINGCPIDKFLRIKKEAAATSYPEENTIIINLDIVKDYFVYIVLAHEIRHIYQYQATLNPSWEEPMAEVWKKEMSNYSASDVPGYENQDIEIDATAFSKIILNLLFKKDFDTNCDKEKLQNRINELLDDFSVAEFIESYEYNISAFNKDQV